ncbi:hypothetical protein [uncultured Tenacibaculum sp.]|uniref:hypothetical protein n=1 Tax=uncultured Tenacibaculum sp. TaxID=174713 RepID=UPI002603F16F|nr:hypothetical protein [uncultured Tenacibaculum sp.]
MKKLKLVAIIAISIVPVFNSIVAIGYGVFIKKFSAAIYAALFLIASVVLLELDSYETNQHLVKTHEVERIEDLEVFYFDDISIRFPQYSLTTTQLSDGYHEEVKLNEGKKFVHKITALGGKFKSYSIIDQQGNLVEDRLKKLHQQQLKNYEKDHPNKKVVFQDIVYRSYYGTIAPFIIIISMIHCFFTLRRRKEDEVVTTSNNSLSIEPSKEVEMIVENEVNANLEVEELIQKSENDLNVELKLLDVNKANDVQFAQLKAISKIQAVYLVKERDENGKYINLSNFFDRNSVSEKLQNELKEFLFVEKNITDDNASDSNERRGRVLDF